MKIFRKVARAACALLAAAGLSACGSSSSFSGASSGAISFATVPPPQLQVGSTLPLNAISHAGSNSMVNWTVTCGSPGGCGQFSPPQTPSGILTTYEAPIAIPSGGTVTLTASAAGNNGQSVSAVVSIITNTPIVVTFSAPPPPPTMPINFNAFVGVKVNNDPVGNGADWTVSCGSPGNCGSFAPQHTPAGQTTTYIAPASIPAGSTVTITATSTTDPSMSDSITVLITASLPTSILSGSYTFVLSGVDANGRSSLAGVLQADGKGTIVSGEQDIYNFKLGHSHDPFTGFYLVGPDGRGRITLNFTNFKLGSGGTEIFSFALVSPSHAVLTEFDPSASSSGTLDLQTANSFSNSTIAGGYTFSLYGQDFSQGMVMGAPSFLHMPLSVGGIFNVNAPGSISVAGSTLDSNDNGSLSLAQSVSGSLQVPDAQGRVQITLTPSGLLSSLVLIGYITDAAHLKLVEIDGTVGATAGAAFGQGVNTGTFTQASSFAGSFVVAGAGASPGMAPPARPLALVALFTSDGVANLGNGLFDLNIAGVPTKGAVGGTYIVDPAGTGRVTLSFTGVTTGGPSTYVLYLTGSADPAPAIEADAVGVTTGFAYSQIAGPFSGMNFQGTYAMGFILVKPDGSAEADANGQALADGFGNWAATWDFNGNSQRMTDVAASGTFTPQLAGRFTGSMSSPLALPIAVKLSYYVVSNTVVVFIETDALGATLGIFEQQLPPL